MPFMGLQVLWGELRGLVSQRELCAQDEHSWTQGLGYLLPPSLQKDGGGKGRVSRLLTGTGTNGTP